MYCMCMVGRFKSKNKIGSGENVLSRDGGSTVYVEYCIITRSVVREYVRRINQYLGVRQQ